MSWQTSGSSGDHGIGARDSRCDGGPVVKISDGNLEAPMLDREGAREAVKATTSWSSPSADGSLRLSAYNDDRHLGPGS